MAYSTQRAVSDGSLNLLDISLDYFDRADISVYFNNIVQTTGWSWVGATEKKISFTPNVPAGVEVLVVRTSDLEAIRHEYSGGAQFTAETLDENMRQLLHIAQEARENANIEDVYRDLNMHGYKLKNVGAGVDPTDAITVQQASAFLDQAETAALLAEQWASGTGVVADGKYSAKHYAEAAEAAAASIDQASLLTKSGNLAGLASPSAARGNLGLGTAATANTGDFQAAMPSATQAEMEAGTESALRAMSPLRVKQAIAALVSASGKLTLATSQNSTSGTAIDFTGIPNWVKRITVMFNGVSTNGSSPVQIQVGSGGVTTTGYAGGSVLLLSSANGISSATAGFQLETGSGSLTSSTARYGSISLSLQSGNTWVASGVLAHTGSASAGITGGAVSLAGALDRVRITTVNGTDTFDAGSLNIVYEG